jgi:hypothetical protein
MIRKLITLPLLFLLIHFLYIACICNCPDMKEKYFKLTNISVQPYGNNNSIIDTGLAVTSTDTITLKYYFVLDCIAQHKNPFAGFINEAVACSCEGCGDHGIKSKIKTIQVTSDSVYSGIPANTSLNNIFKIKNWNYFDMYSNKTLDTVKTLVNNGYGLYSLSLFSVTKPFDAKGHRFTLTLITEDNETKSATTKQIFWY